MGSLHLFSLTGDGTLPTIVSLVLESAFQKEELHFNYPIPGAWLLTLQLFSRDPIGSSWIINIGY